MSGTSYRKEIWTIQDQRRWWQAYAALTDRAEREAAEGYAEGQTSGGYPGSGRFYGSGGYPGSGRFYGSGQRVYGMPGSGRSWAKYLSSGSLIGSGFARPMYYGSGRTGGTVGRQDALLTAAGRTNTGREAGGSLSAGYGIRLL